MSASVALALLVAPALALADPAAVVTPPARPPQPETPARTRLPPGPPAEKVPWERHIEIGGDFVFIQRPASTDAAGKPSPIRYEPTVGFGLHARWDIFKYLRFAAYFINANHDVELPAGSLPPTEAATSPGTNGTMSMDPVHTFSFGARLCPTLPISLRARAWASVGAGWGRIQFGRMTIHDPTGDIVVRERAGPFVEFPLGIGGSFDVIPRWLSVEIELTGAFVTSQSGENLTDVQAIDKAGKKRAVGGFPEIDGTLVQTVGLSLIL